MAEESLQIGGHVVLHLEQSSPFFPQRTGVRVDKTSLNSSGHIHLDCALVAEVKPGMLPNGKSSSYFLA